MEKLVSLIVPAYNVETTLERCLESILRQKCDNKEIILVDDGSNDGTAKICNHYAKVNPEITVIHQKNAGVSAARNTGLAVAQGKYIAFADSDDLLPETYLESLLAYADSDFVTAGFKMQNADNSWDAIDYEEELASTETVRAYPSRYMGKYYFGAPWAKLYRRDIIEAHSLRFDTQVHSGEDTLFTFDYLQYAKNIRIIRNCGYEYYYYESSLAHRVHPDYWKWKIKVEERVNNYFCPCDEVQKENLLNRFFSVYWELLRQYNAAGDEQGIRQFSTHPFFMECLAWKEKTGNREERLLVQCMRHGSYKRFAYMARALSYVEKAIQIIKTGLGKK